MTFIAYNDKIGLHHMRAASLFSIARVSMKILICDDEQTYLNTLRIHVEEYMLNHHIPCTVTALTDPTKVAIDTAVFDLAFLDIQMPGIDGIALAKHLRQNNPKLALFFVTNYDEYQDEAMDLRAFRFFEKPFNANRLYAGLDKAMEYIDGAYVDIFLSENGTQRRVIADDIMYVTRDGRKVSIVTKTQSFCTADKFDDLCEKLPQLFFYPVHKSFLVNLHYVERYSYSEMLLTDGMRIPIAPRKQSTFHKFWFEYLRRR